MIEYPKYKKVLFCTDFSKNADTAFDYAFGIAKRDDSLLYILHVIPGNPEGDALIKLYTTEKERKRIQEDARKDLEMLYQDHYLSLIKDKSKVKIVTKSGRIDEEILKLAAKEKIDLIVIGTHGKSGLEYALMGSVAEKIVRYSPIPVFIIPCKGKNTRKLFK
jgi:universal stress protein A